MPYSPPITWTERAAPIKVGDKVAFAAKHLRDTCQQAGPTGQARGTVKTLAPFGDTFLATVEWDNPEIGQKVVIGNLARVGGKGFALD